MIGSGHDQYLLHERLPLPENIRQLHKIKTRRQAANGHITVSHSLDPSYGMTKNIGNTCTIGLIRTIYTQRKLPVTGIGIKRYHHAAITAPGDSFDHRINKTVIKILLL